MRFDHEISNSNIPGTFCFIIQHPGDVIHLPRAKKYQFILRRNPNENHIQNLAGGHFRSMSSRDIQT